MLIILSDLHLNDGTTGETLSPEAFALFADRLKELAITASWRSDGAYRPIERIDLVLLGDVLDLLHSNRWHAPGSVRPWDDPLSPGLIDQISRITGDILSQNQESLATLRALATRRRDCHSADASRGPACLGCRRSARAGPHPLHGRQPRLVLPSARRGLRRPAAEAGRADGPGQPLRTAPSRTILRKATSCCRPCAATR